MNWTRTFALCFMAAIAGGAFADTGTLPDPHLLPAAPLILDAAAARTDGNVISFAVPKVGFRLGGGEWNDFMVDFGVDVTFNIPVIPLPAIRLDGEVWGEPGNFGTNRKGNAVSILGVQSFALAYFGFGLSYYYTDDEGDHKSGFGAKLLGGMSFQHGTFAEAGIIIGPTTPPIFFTIGQRF